MQEKGVTYRALADQTNLSAGYLNHLVHGNRPVIHEIVLRLSKALGVEPSTSAKPPPADHPGSSRCPS